jgi:hypothetical protein
VSVEPYQLCPGCGKPVEPTTAGVIFAEKYRTTGLEGFGQSTEEPVLELGASFHNESCFARKPRGLWKRKDG